MTSYLMFPVLLQTPLQRRKRFVAIRWKAGESQHDDDSGSDAQQRSVHYLASHYLADSSLSADVSQFDFSGSVYSIPGSASTSAADDVTLTKRKSLSRSMRVSSDDVSKLYM